MIFDVITMGSGLVDIFTPIEAKENNKYILIPSGSKIPIKETLVTSGGGGTNTACSISTLGLKTGFIGKIGSGHNSEIILRDLAKCNISFLGKRSNLHTGYSIILEGERKNRTILTFRGVSNTLKYSEINLSKIKTEYIHFTSANKDLLNSQAKLVDFCIKNEIKISVNPKIIKKGKPNKDLNKIIKNAHIISMNKSEALSFVGKSKFSNLFQKIHNKGPKIVIITDGKNTGGVSDGNYIYWFNPIKINVQECTGAGDAFISSFLSGLIKLKNIENVIKLAVVNSSSVIKNRGAKNGLLTMSKAKTLMKKTHIKITKEKI